MVLSDRAGVKGTRVDGTTTSVGGKELGEGCMEVVGDEGGNDVLVTVGNDEEVTRTNGVEVVLPAGARIYSWLRAGGTRGASLCISVHRFSFQRFDFGLLVQDHGHRRNGGRGTGWNVFNEGGNNGQGVCGVGCRCAWGRDRYAIMEMRGRNGKWLGTGSRGNVWVVRVSVVG